MKPGLLHRSLLALTTNYLPWNTGLRFSTKAFAASW
jgi:hypothetical protein